MPDPTTPAKGLTQPIEGGDDNVWGGYVNADLSLIDSALGGTLPLSISGNTTLNSTQIENSGYEFSGTLTGTATVTWPSFAGMAAIQNGTTGGFSLICKISGGASVTVLNGETVAIWSDGTNFYRLAQAGGGASPLTSQIDPTNTLGGSGALASLASGGVENTAVGYNALNAITTNTYNTAVGYLAGAQFTGGGGAHALTAFGAGAALAVTTGADNVAVGADAMNNNDNSGNVTGDDNIAVGTHALGHLTIGYFNVAIGSESMVGGGNWVGEPTALLTGSDNTAVGGHSMWFIQGAATENTSIGYQSLGALTTGTENIAVGSFAEPNVSVGTLNIAIGRDVSVASAIPAAASFTGSISGAVLTASAVTGTLAAGQVVLGASVTGGTTIGTQISGTTGGAGTYNISVSYGSPVSSEAMTAAVLSNGLNIGNLILGTGVQQGGDLAPGTITINGDLYAAAMGGSPSTAYMTFPGNDSINLFNQAGSAIAIFNTSAGGTAAYPILSAGGGVVAALRGGGTATTLEIDAIFGGGAGTINIGVAASDKVFVGGVLGIPQATWADNQTATPGQISVDANYIYVCTATNTVKRVALSSF